MLTKTEKEKILTDITRKANIINNKLYAKISQPPHSSYNDEELEQIDVKNKIHALVLRMFKDDILECIDETLSDYE